MRSDFRPCAMTLSAEIGRVFRREAIELGERFGDFQVVVVLDDRGKMGLDGFVTTAALDARDHSIQRELLAHAGMGGVATEAPKFFVATDEAPGGIEKIGRANARRPERGTKPVEFAEIADAAFIELAILLEDVGLPERRAGAKGPANRQRQRLCAVRDRVIALVVDALDA